MHYDAVNRLSERIDALNHTRSYTYFHEGNIETVTDENNHTTQFQYDNRNRLKTIIDPNNGSTSYTYDFDDNVLRVDHPNTNGGFFPFEQYEYDARSRMTRSIPLCL